MEKSPYFIVEIQLSEIYWRSSVKNINLHLEKRTFRKVADLEWVTDFLIDIKADE